MEICGHTIYYGSSRLKIKILEPNVGCDVKEENKDFLDF
jgi:hypothetical protein